MLHVAPEQQPLAQLVALQLLHTPAVQVALTGQLSQVSPAVPQALAVFPDRQEEPEQQPLQETESQVQEPPAQCSPDPQDAPVPQRHRPSAEQLSVLIGLQLTHDAPSAPHAANERVSQALPLQQPLGHDVASQTQAPDTQRWPGPHARLVPHWQAPRIEQPSALVESQIVHCAPPVPQVLTDGALQAFARQQPDAHEAASQTQAPLRQRWPAAHAGAPPH